MGHDRFPWLSLTLKSLLAQDGPTARVILNIAYSDFKSLPKSVLELQEYGLEILQCEDLKAFKKFYFTIERFPNHSIVLADDDTFYPKKWLSELVSCSVRHPGSVVCHRAHRVIFSGDGEMVPYILWEKQIANPSVNDVLFPTGVGGVLYPPGSLHADVMNKARFMEICDGTDDVWLFWMARLAGTKTVLTGSIKSFYSWPGSQSVSLFKNNLPIGGGNDQNIENMLKAYGRVW